MLQEALGLTWKQHWIWIVGMRGYSRSTAATAATIDLSRCEHADVGGGHSVRLKRSAHLIRHQTGLRNLDFQGVFMGLHRQRADSKAGAHAKASDRLDLAGNSSPTAGI
ncbi:hypothetical protein NKH52_29205 [Mesorhizobium sp. M1066]|uniref:Uncharacterized protein n=1 Tax=Mesorhizobium opportunistum TaxID=593909 RepID=A0ABV1YJE0_9HYPH